MNKKLFALSVLFWLLSLSAAHSQTQTILPLGGAPEFGCLLLANQTTAVIVKSPNGENRTVTVAVANQRLRKKVRRLNRKVQQLVVSEAPRKRIRKVRRERRETQRATRGLRNCQLDRINELQQLPISFEFFCNHGFRLPTISSRGNDCGVDLRQAISEPFSPDIPGFELEIFDGAITLLDQAFIGACEAEGGTFNRNLNLKEFFPLYHGVCLQPGQPLFVDQPDVITSLGMDGDVNGNCFGSPIRGVPGLGVKDPCDCYDPDAPRAPTGGTRNPRPKPAPRDCIILRMDGDVTDC